MASDTSLQDVIHSLEQGPLGLIIRWALVLAVVASVALVYLFRDFRGLGTADGMDQAQIAREIARGNGYSTKVLRPMALWRLNDGGTERQEGSMPEIYHAPLQPFVNALPLSLFKATWAQPPEEGSFVFAQDRVIAGTSMVFFILSVALVFFMAAMLFDRLVGAVAAIMVLTTHALWDFTLSGLPQMHAMFLFCAAVFCVLLGIRSSLSSGMTAVWLAAAGLLFGLLTLAHGVGLFVALGALIFVAVYFQPRGIVMLWMLGFFLLVVAPWAYRNAAATGSPFGIAHYATVEGVSAKTEPDLMRSFGAADLEGVGPREYFSKIRLGAAAQAGEVLRLMGGCLVAPLFFIALLHPFRRPESAALRWFLLLCWLGAVLGMSVLGLQEHATLQRNNFHILFVPMFAAYGVAFLLVLWNRTNVDAKILKYGLLIVVGIVSAGPFILNLLPTQKGRLHWPPYHPVIVAQIGGEKGWTRANELICSDQPWAVAWYADRDCLWIPESLKEFYEINDMRQAGGRSVAGLLLSPITSDVPFVSGLIRGTEREWRPLAMRLQVPQGFPLKQALPIPVADRLFPDLLYLSDTRRWEQGAAEALSPAVQEELEKVRTEGVPPTGDGVQPEGGPPSGEEGAMEVPATVPEPEAPADAEPPAARGNP